MPDKYDVDYSRFEDITNDDSDDEIEELYTKGAAAEAQRMPPQMRESMRLMKEGQRTGNPALIRRAEALAKEAMAIDPVLRQNVEKHMAQTPGASTPAAVPSQYMGNFTDDMDPITKAQTVTANINKLKADMEAQLAKLKEQEQALSGKNDSIGNCDTPEKMAMFMEQEGFTEEEIEKAFTGSKEEQEEVLKKHTGVMASDDEGDIDLNAQEHVLKQVDVLASQLKAMDAAEARLNEMGEKRKKKGKGKKGRGKVKGGKVDVPDVDAQKAKLAAIRANLKKQLAEAEAKTKEAAKRAAAAEHDLTSTQRKAQEASAKIDQSIKDMEKEKDECSDSDDEIDKEDELQRARAAQAEVLKQQAKIMSGAAGEEDAVPAVQPPKKIEGAGWGGGFFKKDKVETRDQEQARKKAARAQARKALEAQKQAQKQAEVKAKVEAAMGKKSAAVVETETTPAPAVEEAAEPAVAAAATPAAPAAPAAAEAESASEIAPEYVIKRLKEQRVSIQIATPELASMAGVDLDISDYQLRLCAPFNSGNGAGKYVLTINFTDQLKQDGITAKFSKKKRELKVVIPTSN